MPQAEPSNGIPTISSSHSVDETVRRLEDLLRAKSITLFAIIDHSGEAERAGLCMRPTKLIVIAEDVNGAISVSWKMPAYVGARRGIPDPLFENIAAAETLARAIPS